jgi:hypothetical protein
MWASDPALVPDTGTLLVELGFTNRASPMLLRTYRFASSSSLAHLDTSHCRATSTG